MKKDKKTINTDILQNEIQSEEITRKEALLKAGKYAAFTAASMFVILNSKAAPIASVPEPGWGS
jgi:hypothetical protein